jgi:hypothetical protein
MAEGGQMLADAARAAGDMLNRMDGQDVARDRSTRRTGVATLGAGSARLTVASR